MRPMGLAKRNVSEPDLTPVKSPPGAGMMNRTL